MLGHNDVKTTQSYIGVNYTRLRQASEAMSLMSEKPNDNTSTSVGEAADEILFGKLLRREYDPGERINKKGIRNIRTSAVT